MNKTLLTADLKEYMDRLYLPTLSELIEKGLEGQNLTASNIFKLGSYLEKIETSILNNTIYSEKYLDKLLAEITEIKLFFENKFN